MRLAFAASALCLSALGLSFLTQADQPVIAQVAPAPAATAPAAGAPATPAAASAPNAGPVAADAAARHLKRTACLKDAKMKKLIGADKTAFLKACIAEPHEPISASRQIPPDRP